MDEHDDYAAWDGVDEYPDLTPVVPPPDPDEEVHLTRERPGRKTFLTEDVHKAIVDSFSVGALVAEACMYANVSSKTYYGWMRRGRAYDDHLEAGGEIKDGEDIFRLFYLEVGPARAKAKTRALGTIAKAQQDGDWRAAAWYLERTDPQHWGRVNRVEVTGQDGGPVAVQVTEVEQRLSADLAERAERVRVESQAVVVQVAEAVEEADIIDVGDPPQLGSGPVPDDL